MLEDMSTRTLMSSPPTQTLTKVTGAPPVSATQTVLSQLTDEIGFTRSAVGVLHEQVGDLHQRLRTALLMARTERVKETGPQLLGELADLGFAWRHVAMMVGVSVPAVQKWRRGEGMSPDSLDKVATLLATCDLVKTCAVRDVASWFEIRIVPGVPIRPMDLYGAGHLDLLLDWVSQHEKDPERVLSGFEPDWRELYRSDFEVFEADDGELALRRKDN